ncbi:SAM-dependent MidA family methyltransferase [Stella humosa]|uniref:SAM-dependent MidA family methyltransferase n=1 Tax=Stella humosa TaxID=94 RepID=A0A3N1L1Z8_9PROT|nr:SAM-dependent methyltransferase [Stella humosa]ROP84618.1 SAM-dependent MidA family methyltransferase [Stella humosa]BBK34138.1 TetR family transcriptional regulator [Stella humosa]
MTLEQRIAARIRAGGPITVAAFMATALQDPDGGYYRGTDPLGRGGDFTTAPEISQMFGEMIGLWCADGWRADGAPDPFDLVELGPGRGTLMADALRAAAALPAFGQAMRLHLVESSPALRQRQAALLAGARPTWHDRADPLPAGPRWVVANEFLDALPVHQLVRTASGWRERGVGLDGDGNLTFVDDLPVPDALMPAQDQPVGTVVERRPEAEALVADLARAILTHGGRAIFIDYGYAAGHGDTLQAVREHGRVSVLDAPGQVDLSAHVAFADLAAAVVATGGQAWGPVPQGRFLQSLGILARAERLAARRPDARATIAAALHRLIGAGAMGTLFKVFAITRPGGPPPAGFTAADAAPPDAHRGAAA